jgi:general nucleoside transport system ATP-binding protein
LGVPRLHGVGLQLRAGEIVGIAGVSGNGQSELLELLSACAGPRPARCGWVTALHAAHWLDPHARARAGSGPCARGPPRARWCCPLPPGNRPCWATKARPRYSRHGWMRHAAMRQDTAE